MRAVVFVLCVFVLQMVCSPECHADATRPNVVVLLVDDLGWADLSCYGSTYYETPQLDQFAQQAVRFTNAYSAGSICSPTRASLMTGRYPARVGITDYIPGLRKPWQKLKMPDDLDALPSSETTLAELFTQAGYKSLYVGKWHLGNENAGPVEHGFTERILDKDVGNWKRDPTVSDRYTDIVVKRIEENAKSSKQEPFLVYLSYHKVHIPILPHPKTIAHFRDKKTDMKLEETPPMPEHDQGLTRAQQDDPDYASSLAAVDDSVGRILQALETTQQMKNTVVVFLSDNGGLSTKNAPGPTNNHPLRAGKGWLYEGGIRIPMMIKAPDTKPGHLEQTPVITNDLLPTLASYAGIDLSDFTLDGVNIRPLLSGKPVSWQERPLFWHYPHYHGSTWKPGAAIRHGHWKLIEFYHEGVTELYDLSSDLGESHNLANSRPDVVQRMQKQLTNWQAEIGAQFPTPNPNYDPQRADIVPPRKKPNTRRNPKTNPTK